MTETAFTPVAGATGGMLIGLAAILLLASLGRTMGASGIWRNLLFLNVNWHWSAIFTVGLLVGATIVFLALPATRNIQFGSTTTLTAIGGLIVGFGVSLGNGCTSGHGICGISRFSIRSITSTVIFMATAVGTVYVLRHVLA
jgi:uncharacterized protein